MSDPVYKLASLHSFPEQPNLLSQPHFPKPQGPPALTCSPLQQAPGTASLQGSATASPQRKWRPRPLLFLRNCYTSTSHHSLED